MRSIEEFELGHIGSITTVSVPKSAKFLSIQKRKAQFHDFWKPLAFFELHAASTINEDRIIECFGSSYPVRGTYLGTVEDDGVALHYYDVTEDS